MNSTQGKILSKFEIFLQNIKCFREGENNVMGFKSGTCEKI